jgi:hypothetical protein
MLLDMSAPSETQEYQAKCQVKSSNIQTEDLHNVT